MGSKHFLIQLEKYGNFRSSENIRLNQCPTTGSINHFVLTVTSTAHKYENIANAGHTTSP